MKRTWSELVAEGRRAVEGLDDHRWTLGDLAIEAVGVGGPSGVNDGSHGVLGAYADDVGIAANTLRQYRDVAATFSGATRVAPLSFTHHREAARSDDPEGWVRKAAENGWSVNELRAAMGKPRQTNEPPKTSDEKAKVVREYLEDEDVAGEVVDAVSDNPKLTAQVLEQAESKRPAPRKKVREPENIDLAAHLGVGHVLSYALDKHEDSIDIVVGWLRENDADDDTVRAVVEDIGKLRACGDRLHMYAEELQVALDGGVSDERLAQFVEGR